MLFVRTLCMVLLFSFPAFSQTPNNSDGLKVFHSSASFENTLVRLKSAISAHKMGIVAEACADCGARSLGVEIPGNRVVMVFHPRFAVRVLADNLAAGVEAPLRIYVTEHKQGTELSYRLPSKTFAPYKGKDVTALAAELDVILAAILADTIHVP